MEKKAVRLLLVDDSATIRKVVRFGFQSIDAPITIIDEAENGREGVQKALALKPDVILMDLNMPIMSGIEATREIMRHSPVPILIFTSIPDPESLTEEGITAMQAGAVMICKKPTGFQHRQAQNDFRKLARIIIAMSEIQVIRRREYPNVKPTRQLTLERPVNTIIFIGASTGGPAILSQVLKKLPLLFPYPILIAQHMASNFVENFATWLDSETPLRVKIAEEMESLAPGMVYVPPMNTHIGLYPSRQIRLIPQSDEKKICPSVDLLFFDAARYVKEKAIGILLTGMGKDGADGMKKIHDQHGLTLAQEEKSCVVFGMPAAAIKNDAVDFIFTPTEISHYLVDLIQTSTQAESLN